MASFTEVPVLEVNTDNFHQMWPTLQNAIKSSTFVALDVELSGLGERKQLFARDMDTRYSGMCEAARTRSIISLGLSCFQLQPVTQPQQPAQAPAGKSLHFLVQTFNILVLCNENYIVEPASLKFLLDHGFDFNKQYAKGLPYYRGIDKTDGQENPSLRQLFTCLIQSCTPLVLHNGPVDLVFLYESFYSKLPSTVASFVADLSEMVTGGVYDTKYIAEYKARFSASYLEYVFRKCQRQNHHDCEAGLPHTKILFPPYPRSGSSIIWLPCGLDQKSDKHQEEKTTPCRDFASHGWCRKKNDCSYSHDIDTILNREDLVRSKKRKRGKKRKEEDSTEKVDENEANEEGADDDSEQTSESSMDIQVSDSTSNGSTKEQPVCRAGGHRAGFDAFMTGFAFACFLSKYGKYSDIAAGDKIIGMGFEDFCNKVALSGKDIPLQIVKSSFSKTSKNHNEKISKIKVNL